MNYIESKLKEKSELHSEGEIYYRQWMLAKQYLPQLLNTISHVFPHYSLHDASHSETILNNVVRIVGKQTIDKLSIVDLWLLLAAAYYHDCGMVLFAEDKERILEFDAGFVNYVEEKQNDASSPMKEFADLLTVKEGKLYYSDMQLTVKSSEAVRFLMADYVRPKHASRSVDMIGAASSLHLPGSPIPERIIRLLGDICETHTKPCYAVLELPRVECSGCGTEDCHPRYISVLLRLGDLLDMDSNRVSDVLLSTLGSIPLDSLYYNDTNRSITHLQIDEAYVEVQAVCKTYEVYDLMTGWLRWLNEEMTYVISRWRDIVPDISYGYLPSVGSLDVRLEGYDTIDGKVRPSFQIDTAKAIELLQGAGLYDNPAQCIRELLQNSVDATYLRIYRENPNISSLEEFVELCKSYRIEVVIRKTRTDEEYSYWDVEISDSGLGMDKSDLGFLCRTGSSGKNKAKQKLVESMPDWMKPSGIFGIGFQSVFLVTDSVKLSTKKYNSGDAYEMVLNNPSGSSDGSILLKTVHNSDRPVGTSLAFTIKESRRIGWSVNSTQVYAMAFINTYDFAKDESLDVRVGKILDEISMFSDASLIDVHLKFNDDSHVFAKAKPKFEFYDEETGLQISLGKHVSKVFYRNQYLRAFKPGIMFLSAEVNIMTGKANELLTLSRDNVREERCSELKRKISLSLSRFLIQNYSGFDDELKKHVSMFLNWNRKLILSQIAADYIFPTDWESHMLTVLDKEKKEVQFSIKELMSFHIIKKYGDYYEHTEFLRKSGRGYVSFKFPVHSNSQSRDELTFLYRMVGQFYNRFIYAKDAIIITNGDPLIEIEDSDEARLKWLGSYKWKYYARGTMPCPPRYAALEVENTWIEVTFDDFGLDYPIMVCPFVRRYEDDGDFFHHTKCLEYDVDDTIIDYVYNHRKNASVTKDEIYVAYSRLRDEYEPALNALNKK